MPRYILTPQADLLSKEYVLVQAWKKSHQYLRRHSWYADVLELDLMNADLEQRVRDISGELSSDNPLRPDPLRLVLAPKSQQWKVESGEWRPVGGPRAVQTRLRPLAHVSVRDQTIATALMLLLADGVETRQGDPRGALEEVRRRGTVSYGHRLFCDREDDQLHYRWANSIVYRQYFQDYQAFVSRPKAVADAEFPDSPDWAIVYADLSQFYDRVRPSLLLEKIDTHLGSEADKALIDRCRTFFKWSWHSEDQDDASRYAEKAEPPIKGFGHVALPQGLVASGFFANVVLLDFDEAVLASLNEIYDDSWSLIDYCRYVDDMRFLVRLSPRFRDVTETEVAERVCDRIMDLLRTHAQGLVLNPNKCEVILGRDAEAGRIPVSATMKKVNHNTSGVIDPVLGEETMNLVDNLFSYREDEPLDFEDRFRGTFFSAKSDVRDETVARFAAHRFRRTFRALRPLCMDEPDPGYSLLPASSHGSLDNRAIQFCRRMTEIWVRDPCNMRLLRVALDVYPDVRALDLVLYVLRQYIGAGRRRKEPRRVAWYCAAELLKAGATETGLVDDWDSLPAGVEIQNYQEMLLEFAKEIVQRRNVYPWYLEQQALLFLACSGKYVARRMPKSKNNHVKEYLRLHHVLSKNTVSLRRQDIVPFTLLQKRLQDSAAASYTFLDRFRQLAPPTQRRLLLRVLQEDEELSEAIRTKMTTAEQETWRHLYHAHGMEVARRFPSAVDELPKTEAAYSLLDVARSPINPFQQEYAALHFALALLEELSKRHSPCFPAYIKIRASNWRNLWSDRFPISNDEISLDFQDAAESDSRFSIPCWVSENNSWKYRLGQILRVLLTGKPDFTAGPAHMRHKHGLVLYRPYNSSWFRRQYSLFNGRSAFGPTWLPISPWFGALLSQLLEWPGLTRTGYDLTVPEDCDTSTVRKLILDRIEELESLYGRACSTPVLPVPVPKTIGRGRRGGGTLYKMRIGVVQTVIPRLATLARDPELNAPNVRFSHRRHLATMLGAVHRMLQVRETHFDDGSGIDLLLLPELSVHPKDIRTHLRPFALQHRCVVFAGAVFHPKAPDQQGLVNSGYWIIPVEDARGGVHFEHVEQGKWHLASKELKLGITSFRPAQWLLQFIDPRNKKRLWAMSGAICYDATDIRLGSDLRDATDMFVVPSLNKDVGTFDNMAAALHYHMYQHVIVVNSGEFGGSTGQAPFDDRHRRTIFHTHGNDQATVSFFEVDLNMYRNRSVPLKTPPAGHLGRT